METNKTKTGQAANRYVPSKPAYKKRRIFPWLFLLLFLVGGIAGAGFYYRLIPMDPETAAKIEPLVVKTEELVKASSDFMGTSLEKLMGGKKSDDETIVGKPKTNFSLVELEETKKNASPTATISPADVLGPSSIASAAPAQPAAGTTGAIKPVVTTKESAETAKTYGKLSKLYSAMKPEEAVAVFNNLEDEQVVSIISRMEDEAAGRVLAVIEPKRAARLTQSMIKRK